MNKKAIWAIIGVMSAAIIGVVWLQMSLIYTSMKVNEEKFDKAVRTALQSVTDRLEEEERRQAENRYFNGFMTTYYQREKEAPKKNDHLLSPDLSFSNLNADHGFPRHLLDRYIQVDTCKCYYCLSARDENMRRVAIAYSYRDVQSPLEDRIDLKYLATILEQELSDIGIEEYTYGIYSKWKKSFVIANDHYVVDQPQSGDALAGFRNIYNSEYKVSLFSSDDISPGWLRVFFPYKSAVVWKSLWLNLLGTLIFTTIILLSFIYTITVIIRQKKLSEMKTDFINNMTHEFKTPIATISLAADSISSPMISGHPDKVSRFANIIKQENKRMNSQVEKVLQMALIDKREFSLKLTNVNLHDIILNAVENINLQVEKKEGTVVSLLDAENAMVEGDVTHISNVVNNLLDNANKYSPEKPEISVQTRNVLNGVEVIISDKGMGMSKEARKHIFDKFYRVHTGNLHDIKGFGLGLSYVKAIMTAHKGQIEVKSELGKGSSFILLFPFQVEAKQ